MPNDTRRFVQLARHYRRRYAALEQSGSGCYQLTSLGAWATSRAAHVFYFFRTIGLDRCRLFIDLGSGDGIVTCIAGLFTRAVGIEADPGLCATAHHTAAALALNDRTAFLCGDYLRQRITRADCLYIYPDKPLYSLEQTLAAWPGTLLVYGPHLPPRRFVPARQLHCGREQLTVYRNPLPHPAAQPAVE